jgi:hypothetical protein
MANYSDDSGTSSGHSSPEVSPKQGKPSNCLAPERQWRRDGSVTHLPHKGIERHPLGTDWEIGSVWPRARTFTHVIGRPPPSIGRHCRDEGFRRIVNARSWP